MNPPSTRVTRVMSGLVLGLAVLLASVRLLEVNLDHLRGDGDGFLTGPFVSRVMLLTYGGAIGLLFLFSTLLVTRHLVLRGDRWAEAASRLLSLGLGKTNLISVCLACLGAAGILELCSALTIHLVLRSPPHDHRANLPPSGFHPYLDHVHPPDSRVKWAEGRFIETDRHGNSITPLSPPDPKLRVAITGGSTVFGVGASSNEWTVPSLVEKGIRDDLGIETEVTNLAVRNFQTFQEMLRLNDHLARERADLVLVVTGRNDAFHSYQTRDLDIAFPSDRTWREAVPIIRRAEEGELVVLNLHATLRSTFSTIDLLSRIVETVNPVSKRPPLPGTAPTATERKGRVELTLTHLRMMHALARSRNAEPLFILQPTAFSKKALHPDEKGVLERNFLGDARALEAYGEHERGYYDDLRRGSGELPFLDLSHVLDGTERSTFIDSCHYNDEGATILARAIVESVRDRIRALTGR